MVWCVAAPFFIGSISRGRTVRQTILGGYIFGVGSTLTSFIVLGNYSMGMQVTGKADFIAQYLENGDLYGMIVSIIKTMPGAPVVMVVVLLTMIAFYATSFDSIALTASCYSSGPHGTPTSMAAVGAAAKAAAMAIAAAAAAATDR